MSENIAIITGGNSSEREVAEQTAETVSQSLSRQHIHHQLFNITSINDLYQLDLTSFTRVFLALHGGFGENGQAQSYLDFLGITYNGPSPTSSSICMDKILTKLVARGLHINVPRYVEITDTSLSYEEISGALGTKLIVKPVREGCSFGVSLIENSPDAFYKARQHALSFNAGILVEEYIPGRELSVCFLAGELLPSFQLDFQTPFFSYDAKFSSPHTTASLIDLKPSTQGVLQRNCKLIAHTLELDYFRADVIIHDDLPYLIELNTLPGLTSHSLFPKACMAYGWNFDELILYLNNLVPAK
ncbi:ATP-grasp domain-containing protein [Pseudomonas sp. S60]|uniref:D-alanine--D-alanine ligase family protein n=1 Tax=Pseudomonas sp. S60 TaxID=211124 RepID=UPI0019113999|nr:ATP-grasp domain-containing protein [Pseudomonas sp. S60]MBK5012306.1 ATP-grasp domain-containing protein [Pseudomonas sp. S60]